MFTEDEMSTLRNIVFQPQYPGYRPTIVESPNGDGKVDTEKRYAHVAPKYRHPGELERVRLRSFYQQAFNLACRVGSRLVHHYYAPSYEHCALRVLEYPPGAGSHEHTDFNLFTLMLYRNQPDKFVHDGRDHIPPSVRKLNEQCHLGEITEILGTGPATKHSVLPSETTQVSAVFFAIPNHEAVLPNGMKVGDWIAERVSRSRYDK